LWVFIRGDPGTGFAPLKLRESDVRGGWLKKRKYCLAGFIQA